MKEEEKLTSRSSKWKRITKKKWVLPAIYLGSAALILTGVLWYQAATDDIIGNETDNVQDVADKQLSQYPDQQEAVPVNALEENFKMPVLDENEVKIKKQFYDNNASSEEQEAALVVYNNTYYPSTGIDIAMENGESFDVAASLSGTVIRAENDPILGNVVEIKHENDVVTFYQSLDEMHVEQGTEVVQGEVIGTAGTSIYDKDAGVHVHFEIRQNNEPVNPIEFFNKPLSSIDVKAEAAKNEAKKEKEAEAVNEKSEANTANEKQQTEATNENVDEANAADSAENADEGEASEDNSQSS
ncbi:M23 family metallopeptidase [Calidifontibacillus oryziterrae]|uniref:M23 family metallopeptidase n=1 Tax=Calidifontibacillus oryziterrae TaxID=1191699 RepID=UPI0002EE81ED|nr:M23 family metallopeptidase [Calidifontibacillus oryziterrae]